MIDTLTTIFGSKTRVRVMRLFLLNPDTPFRTAEIADKTMMPSLEVQKEMRMLEKVEFVTARKQKGKKVYRANVEFPLREDLLTMLTRATVMAECKTLANVEKIGEVHVALVSGIFLNFTKARADLFIVANEVSRVRLARFIKTLEAEMGREVSYVLLTMEEFKYRLNMTDRFLQDFLSAPYDEVVNTIPNFKRIVSGLRKK